MEAQRCHGTLTRLAEIFRTMTCLTLPCAGPGPDMRREALLEDLGSTEGLGFRKDSTIITIPIILIVVAVAVGILVLIIT